LIRILLKVRSLEHQASPKVLAEGPRDLAPNRHLDIGGGTRLCTSFPSQIRILSYACSVLAILASIPQNLDRSTLGDLNLSHLQSRVG